MNMNTQLDTEDWKAINKEVQSRKDRQRVDLTELVERFCINNEIRLQKFTPYQFRLAKSPFTSVDVYTTSSKIRLLKKGEKSKTVDLYKWLKKHFAIE